MARRVTRPKAQETEKRVRKNYRLQQSMLDEAREVLGTETETETIERALALAMLGKRLAEGTRRALGRPWKDPFEPDE